MNFTGVRLVGSRDQLNTRNNKNSNNIQR